LVRQIKDLDLPPSCGKPNCDCHYFDETFYSDNLEDLKRTLTDNFQFEKQKIDNFLYLCQSRPEKQEQLLKIINDDQELSYNPSTILQNQSHIFMRSRSPIDLVVNVIRTLVRKEKTILVTVTGRKSIQEIQDKLKKISSSKNEKNIPSLVIEKKMIHNGGGESKKDLEARVSETNLFFSTFYVTVSPAFLRLHFDCVIALNEFGFRVPKYLKLGTFYFGDIFITKKSKSSRRKRVLND
jgi:hypothetical protein